uniref:Uncharacterized protein n=1 Tax=Molossus molossus TaxID=27622 RepID=A0A7J8JXJ3_MOLMO|nr:hypothetical protein HJG59_008080 [Molossus molossus]
MYSKYQSFSVYTYTYIHAQTCIRYKIHMYMCACLFLHFVYGMFCQEEVLKVDIVKYINLDLHELYFSCLVYKIFSDFCVIRLVGITLYFLLIVFFFFILTRRHFPFFCTDRVGGRERGRERVRETSM